MSGAPRKKIPPPKGDDDFEDLARALFSAVWKDPGAKLHGRSGQGQDGVDVYGEDRARGTGLNGVQCKQHGSNTLVTDKALLKGSMRLHECDAHLEWARLCRQRRDRDGLERHVARARKLVEETGYGRRRREVEWLERQLG